MVVAGESKQQHGRRGSPDLHLQRSSVAAQRILLVDPCRDVLASSALLLRLWGHEVVETTAGPTAIDAARRLRPNVVISELALPGLDGFEVARRLRNDFGPELLLLAVTGYGDDSSRRGSREAGFDDHLVKPFDPEELRLLLLNRRL